MTIWWLDIFMMKSHMLVAFKFLYCLFMCNHPLCWWGAFASTQCWWLFLISLWIDAVSLFLLKGVIGVDAGLYMSISWLWWCNEGAVVVDNDGDMVAADGFLFLFFLIVSSCFVAADYTALLSFILYDVAVLIWWWYVLFMYRWC